MRLESIPDVADVERLGAAGDPDFLVEVPHGADERAHYDVLRSRLRGALPEDLHIFFHMNTDVGAWACGRATAEEIVRRDPRRRVLLVRSRIPRTLVDCNRPADYAGGDLEAGALTAGLPVYVRDPQDRALLLDLHRQYVSLAEAAYRRVCESGGQALCPHTYGPRSVGIRRVGDDIVQRLRETHRPEVYESWPLRAEVELLTRDASDRELSPPGVERRLLRAFGEAGFEVVANRTYRLLPPALGHAWAARWPGRITSLEIRRDLLVERWRPFEPMAIRQDVVRKIGRLLGGVLSRDPSPVAS